MASRVSGSGWCREISIGGMVTTHLKVISAMRTHAISAEVPDTLYRRLNAVAERTGQSPAWVTVQALQHYLDTDDARHLRTLVALADVDAGRILNDEQMDTWMLKTFGPQPVSEETA